MGAFKFVASTILPMRTGLDASVALITATELPSVAATKAVELSGSHAIPAGPFRNLAETKKSSGTKARA